MAINFQSNVFPPGMDIGQVNTSVQGFTSGQVVPVQLDQSGRLLVTEEHVKPTYRAAAVAQTFYSTAAAVLLEIQGSSSMTVRVKKILLWAQCATKYYAELTIGRAASLAQTGSPSSLTVGKMDKNDAAATATVNIYTAAATSGTGFAAFDARILGIAPPSASMI